MEHHNKLIMLGFKPTFGGKYLINNDELQIVYHKGFLIGILDFKEIQKEKINLDTFSSENLSDFISICKQGGSCSLCSS